MSYDPNKNSSCVVCGKSLAGMFQYKKLLCSDYDCYMARRRQISDVRNNKQYQAFLSKWLAGDPVRTRRGDTGSSVSNHIRRYLFEKHSSTCAECGWNRIHPITGKVPLTVEHKDGNWQNDAPDNLTLLCPGCHSLTPTYCGLNRGNGRPRGKKGEWKRN